MSKDKGWEFLFGKNRESGSFSDGEGNEGYIYSDGSGYFHGADGSDGYIYSDGSGYYHGSDGSDGYKYSDGSGYFRGGSKNIDAYQYSDGSGYYEDSNNSRENYWPDEDLSNNNEYTYIDDNTGDDKIGVGSVLFALGLFGLAVASAKKTSTKDKCEYDECYDNDTNEHQRLSTNKTQTNNKRDSIIVVIALCLVFLIPLCVCLGFFVNKTISEHQGKISAGYYKDLVGENYESVEAHFRAAGFTNIELVDLNDSGLAFWNNNKVTLISIGGVTDFESTDYFYPDAKVVISYH